MIVQLSEDFYPVYNRGPLLKRVNYYSKIPLESNTKPPNKD